MSQKERDRMKVIHQVAQGELRQRQAAQLVGLSERQVRLIRECYSDFGPTLAGETLAERDGIVLSRETLRGWMIAEGLWKARSQRVGHRQWRERRACVGELVQMDTSIHDWFEGRGEQAMLIKMVDDPAHSPQAKGRVERAFGTAQDRLIKKMRLANVSTIQEANAFLEGYLREHNAKYAVPPACSHDAHRSLRGFDLAGILSHQQTRVVGNDYTIQYYSQRYQIEPKGVRAGLRKATVTVQQRLDGSVRVSWRGKCLPAHRITAPRPTVRPTAPAPPRPPHKPAPDHPCRRDRNRTLLPGTKADISTLR